MPPGHQPEDMQHMGGMGSSGAMGTLSSMTSSFSNMTDDNDDYMDYMAGGSPLGLSSESSNQDRSCTSTPVGNDSSPAGENIIIFFIIIIIITTTTFHNHQLYLNEKQWIEMNRKLKLAIIS